MGPYDEWRASEEKMRRVWEYVHGVHCNESKTIQMFVWDHKVSVISGVISIHFPVVLALDLAAVITNKVSVIVGRPQCKS